MKPTESTPRIYVWSPPMDRATAHEVLDHRDMYPAHDVEHARAILSAEATS